MSGHCTCMAGLDECCSHVGATLWYLETGHQRKQYESVTDVPSYWRTPTSNKKRHEKVKNLDFSSSSKRFKKMQAGEDSTPQCTFDISDNIPSPTKQEQFSMLSSLHTSFPQAAIFSVHPRFNYLYPTPIKLYPVDVTKFFQPDTKFGSHDDVIAACEKLDLSVSFQQVTIVESVFVSCRSAMES